MGYDDETDLHDQDSYPERDQGSGVLPWVIGLGVTLLLLAGGRMVFSRFARAKSHRTAKNEGAAVGGLKAISMAQTLHREGDKDNDGTLDYAADLRELGKGGLIDSVLAGGTKQGYVFETHSGPQPQFQWFATADPVEPGETGMRFFYVDQSDVIYYSRRGPIQGPLDSNKLPPGVLRLDY